MTLEHPFDIVHHIIHQGTSAGLVAGKVQRPAVLAKLAADHQALAEFQKAARAGGAMRCRRDLFDAKRGFLGTVENARIANPQGRVVWSLEPYGFLGEEKAPPTVAAG